MNINKTRRADISVERNPTNSSYTLAVVVAGRRFSRAYYGFSKKEALDDFMQEVRALEAGEDRP